ncbi:hypothetical protein QCE62_05635 [Caballeronia sp. LZ033]|uniref:hypothetical protein n=1 Tax=Caballeronia sp. LZ033 TaxID=3038566 RepID=UPI002867A242|nr:hypothetical protein [Caballeronia sp. LZ033]MDR5813071.1 hypothetical protein [Caballeronia sp. LZ033]
MLEFQAVNKRAPGVDWNIVVSMHGKTTSGFMVDDDEYRRNIRAERRAHEDAEAFDNEYESNPAFALEIDAEYEQSRGEMFAGMSATERVEHLRQEQRFRKSFGRHARPAARVRRAAAHPVRFVRTARRTRAAHRPTARRTTSSGGSDSDGPGEPPAVERPTRVSRLGGVL